MTGEEAASSSQGEHLPEGEPPAKENNNAPVGGTVDILPAHEAERGHEDDRRYRDDTVESLSNVECSRQWFATKPADNGKKKYGEGENPWRSKDEGFCVPAQIWGLARAQDEKKDSNQAREKNGHARDSKFEPFCEAYSQPFRGDSIRTGSNNSTYPANVGGVGQSEENKGGGLGCRLCSRSGP